MLSKLLDSDTYWYSFARVAVPTIATLIGVIVPTYSLFIKGQEVLAFLLSGLAAGVFIAVYQAAELRNENEVFEDNKVFSSVVDPSTIWTREDTAQEIADWIGSAYSVDVMVGESGVGKTILIENEVRKKLNSKGLGVHVIRDYDNISDRIGGFERDETVVFLDQFEQVLKNPSNKNGDILESVETELDRLQEMKTVYPVIVIQKRWFFDLATISSEVPPPREAFEVPRLNRHSSLGTGTILDEFERALNNEEVASEVVSELCGKDQTFLPIEAKVVGTVLEDETTTSGRVKTKDFYKQYDNKNKIIEDYFRKTIDASKYPESAKKILMSLSANRDKVSSLKAKDIAFITHDTDEIVDYTLGFFGRKSIVEEEKNKGYFRLAHKYIAEKFYDLSSSILDPTDRDNILHFYNEIDDEENHTFTFNDLNMVKNRHYIGYSIFCIIYTILSLRLFFPEIFTFLDLSPDKLFGETLVDVGYIPIFVTLLGWATYITLLYNRFLSRLDESWPGKVTSLLVVITCALGALTSAVWPSTWLLVISFVGLVVAIKFFHIQYQPHLSVIASDFFKNRGQRTINNMLSTLIIGVLFFISIVQYEIMTKFPIWYMVSSAIIALVMIPQIYRSIKLHCSNQSSSTMVNMYNRS